MKTLTDLKRYLATPNATLTMTGHALLNRNQEWIPSPVLHNPNPRTVKKLQTNAVALNDNATKSGESWLDFGKASEWTFTDNTATLTSSFVRLTYTIGGE